jgi:hypothetical protein
MHVLRRAVVLVLLGLSLGISGAGAATGHSEVRPQTVRSAADRIGSWWNFVMSVWTKADCRIDPLGQCVGNPAMQAPVADARCTINPWGRCGGRPDTQTLSAEEGCAADPWGHCLPGH